MSEKSKAIAFLNKILKGRPQPSSPRAGFKASGSRYNGGGKLSKKKTV